MFERSYKMILPKLHLERLMVDLSDYTGKKKEAFEKYAYGKLRKDNFLNIQGLFQKQFVVRLNYLS